MPNNNLISKDNVLEDIAKLQKSPWYNAGKELDRNFPYPHLEYIARKEAVIVIRDLCIKQEPTVDAMPVVHGHWIVGEMQPHMTCSVCEHWFSLYQPTNYCPNCGAKMDGDENA